jgi:transcriptional regulator with XRE-family HTH domain
MKATIERWDGRKLQAAREAKGLTREQFAERATQALAERRESTELVLAEDVAVYELGADCPGVNAALVFAHILDVSFEHFVTAVEIEYEPEWLRKERQRIGASLRSVARWAHVQPETLAEIETKGTTNGDLVIRVLDALSARLSGLRGAYRAQAAVA